MFILGLKYGTGKQRTSNIKFILNEKVPIPKKQVLSALILVL